MICERCGNTDPQLFYHGSRGIYCRKCIRFRRYLIEEEEEAHENRTGASGEYFFRYPLTETQKEAVLSCRHHLARGKDVFLKAVCGAGKTEMCVPLLGDCLKQNKKVGFAIARREVVIEIAHRLTVIFPHARVVAVYGGHHQQTDGDIIVCTTHQLYRYPKTFGLLILDEVDAFPFRGDEVLWAIAQRASYGRILYSSATADEKMSQKVRQQEVALVSLARRPHNQALPVPTILLLPLPFLYLLALHRMNQQPRQMLIFMPTKRSVKVFSYFARLFFKVDVCYSDKKDREEVIQRFAQKKCKFLVCTSVLERGVTFPDIDVLILVHRKGIFDRAAYIQMCGRAGRNFLHPYGKVWIYSSVYDTQQWACRKEICDANKTLSLLPAKHRTLFLNRIFRSR